MPTLSDVADRAGVSKVSASVALNGSKSGTILSDATRERILLAAQELGYKRNGSMAAGLTGKFNSVALLLSTNEIFSALPQRMWDGIHDELATRNMTLSMARLPDDKLTDEGVVPKLLREWMCDGFLIDYTDHIPHKMLELIRGHQLPVAWINSKQESDCVFPDDFEAGCHATQHLLDLGHTRITYANFAHRPDDPEEHYSGRDRFAGYEVAMKRAGLQTRVLLRQEIGFADYVGCLKKVLSEAQGPTALVSYGSAEPEIALVAADQLQMAVPGDLSLVAIDPREAILGRQMTMLRVPQYELGRRAVQMLLEKIENPLLSLPSQSIPFEFFNGGTSGAPRGK